MYIYIYIIYDSLFFFSKEYLRNNFFWVLRLFVLCAYVCVRARERDRQTERETEREKDRERHREREYGVWYEKIWHSSFNQGQPGITVFIK